jgi:type II secretory ATPase GspE/PulE/Tfp pilus assembly ATPase PilB-like protein
VLRPVATATDSSALREVLRTAASRLNASSSDYVPELVDAVLNSARQCRASDVHLIPTESDYKLSWRVDGLLHSVDRFPTPIGARMATRLKVLSHLLTYETTVPQEGRIESSSDRSETRVSSFPTIFGEKIVVRLFAASGSFERLDDLGLPPDVVASLRRDLEQTGGVIIITGPAGSGKTTTAYAALRELADKSAGTRSLVSLEDPVEGVIPGVSQSQVGGHPEFDMARGLRSIVRQDPEVILVGEIRDRSVAEVVFQAALSGHLVITTFHAGQSAQAVSRLSEMGIEPYLLRSCILNVISQRLIRRLCRCVVPPSSTDPGLLPPGCLTEIGRTDCPECRGTGYSGRVAIAESLRPTTVELARSILSRDDAQRINELAVAAGMISLRSRAEAAVAAGETSLAELYRVLGSSDTL